MSSVEKININKGFSKISHQYEALEKTNGLVNWMRKRVRTHLLKELTPNAKILEINCGTGIDAVFLAKKNYQILATDIADDMLAYVKDKIEKNKLEHNISYKKLSFTDLNILQPQKFNHIFSNFGGLNCSSKKELQTVFNSFNDLLLPNGKITLVIMPKICLWEFLRIFKGKKSAFRRLQKNGVTANIKSENVQTYYYSSKIVIKMLQDNFSDFKVENICFFAPTGNRNDFPVKHPKLFRFLVKFDVISNKIPFLQGYGDYFILTATKK